MPYSGSIVGRICVPAGGGDESLVATAFGELPMSAGAKVLTTLMRLAVVLVPLLVAALFWAFYRYHSLVGRQRRDSGSVIGFAIKVPTDRSHR